MNQGKIEVVADALAEANRNGGTVPELDEALLPTNWQEAFQVQDALDERLGFELTGWKKEKNDEYNLLPPRRSKKKSSSPLVSLSPRS